MNNGRALGELRGHTEAIVSASFSTDGRSVITGSADDTARIWNVATGSSRQLVGHEAALTAATFSPDGRTVLTASRAGEVRTWSAASGMRLKSLIGHVALVSDARFSPDGRWIVTAGPGTAGVCQTTSGRHLFFLRGHQGALSTALFGPKSDWIVTGGTDGTVRRYRCVICGRLPELRPLARSRLAALDRARAAARG
jgi:WD40 repeat protein